MILVVHISNPFFYLRNKSISIRISNAHWRDFRCNAQFIIAWNSIKRNSISFLWRIIELYLEQSNNIRLKQTINTLDRFTENKVSYHCTRIERSQFNWKKWIKMIKIVSRAGDSEARIIWWARTCHFRFDLCVCVCIARNEWTNKDNIQKSKIRLRFFFVLSSHRLDFPFKAFLLLAICPIVFSKCNERWIWKELHSYAWIPFSRRCFCYGSLMSKIKRNDLWYLLSSLIHLGFTPSHPSLAVHIFNRLYAAVFHINIYSVIVYTSLWL